MIGFTLQTLLRKSAHDSGWELDDWPHFRSAYHAGELCVEEHPSGDVTMSLLPTDAALALLPLLSDLPLDAATGTLYLDPQDAGISERIAARYARAADDLLRCPQEAMVTERWSPQSVRVGQEIYRERLLDRWGGACAVTGLAEPELLRASHAKPWSVANDRERLDPANGLPLIPNLDMLFDAGYIAFDDSGIGLFSSRLSASARVAFGISDQLHLVRPPHPDERIYLAWHRQNVYCKK